LGAQAIYLEKQKSYNNLTMALYHKYRPQTFSSVVGQEHIVTTLMNQVATDKVAHAYLFSGPRGVGKTTLARILAKAINCPDRKHGEAEPCNLCNPCEEIRGSRSIDVIEIDAASHTGVDNVRENIIDNAQFKPTKSPFKIFIIDEVHMLSTSAFNALLKTLEEPPKHVMFILATTELHKLPETIVSRCQRFDFKRVNFDTLKKHLTSVAKGEEIKIENEVIERIINKSDGCVRDAVSLLDQIMATGEKKITAETASLVLPNTNAETTLAFLTALVDKNAPSALEIIQKLADDGVDFVQFNKDLIELMRLLLLSKSGVKLDNYSTDLDEKAKKEVKKLADKLAPRDPVRLLDIFMTRGNQIKLSPIPQMPLEMGVIEWVEKEDDANGPQTSGPANNTNNNDQTQTEKLKNLKTDQPAEPKKTIVERVKEMVSKEPDFTLADVNAKWGEFLTKVEKQFPSLAFILKMAEVTGLDGNTIKINVPYNFHRDKIMEKACQRNLETVLSEVIGKKACLEPSTQAKDEPAPVSNELQELASSLGGEVVS